MPCRIPAYSAMRRRLTQTRSHLDDAAANARTRRPPTAANGHQCTDKTSPTHHYKPTDIRQHGTMCAAADARTRCSSTTVNAHQRTDKTNANPPLHADRYSPTRNIVRRRRCVNTIPVNRRQWPSTHGQTPPPPTATPTDIRQHGTMCAAADAQIRYPSTATNGHQRTDKTPANPPL